MMNPVKKAMNGVGQRAMLAVIAVAILAVGACDLYSSPSRCENGMRCPEGSSCTADGTACTGNTCGNGILDPAEACDDGNIRDGDGCCGDCRVDCESCGDGVVAESEACDDGNERSGDGCSADCLSDETCGNGYRDIDETCDDGNLIDGDGCSARCVLVLCGNGRVDPGEICDDGNTESDDGCCSDCTGDCHACGNGFVDPGEECDELEGTTATCDLDCTSPVCGDGLLNAAAGEQCDDGNDLDGDGCTVECTIG